jgi:hypothetical protein
VLDNQVKTRIHLPKITQNSGEIARSLLPSLSSPRHFHLQTIRYLNTPVLCLDNASYETLTIDLNLQGYPEPRVTLVCVPRGVISPKDGVFLNYSPSTLPCSGATSMRPVFRMTLSASKSFFAYLHAESSSCTLRHVGSSKLEIALYQPHESPDECITHADSYVSEPLGTALLHDMAAMRDGVITEFHLVTNLASALCRDGYLPLSMKP